MVSRMTVRGAGDSDLSSTRVIRRITVVIAIGALAGMLSAILANGFVAAIHWLNDLLLISPRSRMMAQRDWFLVSATVAVPAVGGLVVGLLHRMIRERRAHAPADVIAAIQTRRGRLPAKPAMISGLSSLVALGSGASVGQYGPLVHLGGALGSWLARVFRASTTIDNIAIACGVAAAISTVFHAPIGGILFAHEALLRHFALRAFAPIALASILGYLTANLILPQQPLFQVGAAAVEHLWEFGPFLLLGIACAAVAVIYMQAILAIARAAARMPIAGWLRPALAGAGLGLMALWVPDILGIGRETLRFALIDGAYSQFELLLILTLKIFATALCLGMGFSGGVFAPALVIGSLFGALFGSLLGSLAGVDTSALAVYAVCGMVAVTAPVIGAPLATIAIVFELTGNYGLTIAAMTSVALSNLVVSRLLGRSFFDRQLADRGLDLSSGRSKVLLETRTLEGLVRREYPAVSDDVTVAAACAAMIGAGTGEAFMVDARQRYQGALLLQDLLGSADDQAANQFLTRQKLALRADTTIWGAMEILKDFVGESVAVVDNDHRLMGVVYESDLIEAYLDTLAEMRREEHATA